MWALNGPDDHVLARASVAKKWRRVTSELATGMADEERMVVSGDAFGMEGAAHRAALAAGGHTIAVLANGLDRTYPNAHTDLLNRIGDTGLLLSELPPGTAPTKDRFTVRNRLLTPLVDPPQARDLGRSAGAGVRPGDQCRQQRPQPAHQATCASLITGASDVIALLDVDQGTSRTTTRPQVGREFSQRRQTPDSRGCSI